jgi:hypothetical protein
VEAVQFHANTQSHWSVVSTVFFPSRGPAVHVPEIHKLAMEPGFSIKRCLDTLVTPRWLITCLTLGSVLTMGSFTMLRADNVKKPAVITHCLPQFHSTPCRSSSVLSAQWPVRAPVKLLGGALWRPCNFTLTHSVTGLVGEPFSSCLGGQRFTSRGCTNSQWNWVSPVIDVSLQNYHFGRGGCRHQYPCVFS